MAKAKRQKNGKWRTLAYDYKDENGQRHYKSFTADTKKESEYMAAQYLMSARKKDMDKTISELLNSYIDARRGSLSPATIRCYVNSLKRYEDIADIRADKLNQATHQDWIDTLKENGYSSKTIRNVNGLLMSALNHYEIAPTYKIILPQKEDKFIYVPTDAEIKQVIDYLRENDKELLKAVYLAAFGTLRRGEIAPLTAKDVDRENCTITIQHGEVRNENNELVIKQPKNSSSRRIIKYPPFVIDALPKRGKLVNISLENISKNFAKVIDKLDVHKFTFHDLRHYSASIMHAIGVPDVYIMERGGWSSDRTLKQIYRNSMDDYRKKYTDTTNDYFTEKMK